MDKEAIWKSMMVFAFGAWATVVWDTGKSIAGELSLVRQTMSTTKETVVALSVRVDGLNEHLRRLERRFNTFDDKWLRKLPYNDPRRMDGRYKDHEETRER